MYTKTATDLLTDIIAQTNKFQHPEVIRKYCELHPFSLKKALTINALYKHKTIKNT